MRLANDTVTFPFGGIPILGSYDSGNVIGLTPEGFELCKRMREDDVVREEVEAVDSRLPDVLERGLFLQRGDAVEQPPSKTAYVHVTQRCNLSCVGCYSLDDKRNSLCDAPGDRFRIAFEKLVEMGVRGIIVSGGEPFLRADLPELCEEAKGNGIAQVTVITNGTLVTEGTLSRLAPFVDCVSVSFDGASQDAPSYIRRVQRFDELVKAVALIQNAGIKAHMIPTIHGKNYTELAEYSRLSDELGISMNFSLLSCCDFDDEAIRGLVPDGETLEAMGRSVFELGKESSVDVLDLPVGSSLSVRRNCGAVRTTLSVDADGAVYPCHMLHRPKLAMGNIFSDDAATIANSPVVDVLASLNAEEIEGCRECAYAPICGGGCRARAYAEYGSLTAPDPYCPMTREFYRCLECELAEAYR